MSLLGDLVRHPIIAAKLIAKRIRTIPEKGLPRFHARTSDGFDDKYGVETDGQVQITATNSPNLMYGTRYQATPENVIRFAIENSGLSLPETTFIDIGCGKGRALIVASTYPFKTIVGVEYAPDLAEIAQQNVDRIGATGRCTVLCQDAVEYRFPDGPLLTFFYNPFEEVVHSQVLDHLAHAPGPVRIAHVGPGNDFVAAFPGVTILVQGPNALNVYEMSQLTALVAKQSAE
jgi:SAM-dependent methyltransferase